MIIYTADRVLTERGIDKEVLLGVEEGCFQFVAVQKGKRTFQKKDCQKVAVQKEVKEKVKGETKNELQSGLQSVVQKEIQKGVKKAKKVIDFGDKIIVPGFIDIHTHGGGGYSFGSGQLSDLLSWASFKASHGVTGFLPTTSAVAVSELLRASELIREGMEACENSQQHGAKILGWHLEGPFFRESRKLGAQNRKYVVEKLSGDYKEILNSSKKDIAYLTLDPLIEDADEILEFCRENEIVIAAGHSVITHQEFQAVIEEGYSSVVHTFNGMRGLHHRKPGLAFTACRDEHIFAEIICDGHHVSLPMLKMFFTLKETEKIILITDAMKMAGNITSKAADFGNNEVTDFGYQDIYIDDKGRALLADGTLAGSTLTMDRALQIAVEKAGLSLERAIRAISLNPAKLLGIADRKGSIASGKDADFVVLNNNLQIESVYCQGKEVFFA